MNSVYACSYIRKAGHAVGILEWKIGTIPLKVEHFGGLAKRARASSTCYFEYGMQFSCTTNRDVCSGIVLSKNISCKAGDGYSNIIIVEDIQGW